MVWYNKPAIWSEERDRVYVRVDGGTDFWR
ncbi:MAG: DUF1349 domain-containing protein, partial [Pedobacter sp.]